MNDEDTRRQDSFLRGEEFGHLNAARFPAGSYVSQLFAQLTHIIVNLRAAADRQSSNMRAAQQGTTSKASLRDEILLDLRAIARTARALALTMPGLEDRFRLPHNLKEQALLSVARTFMADAAPLKAEFIRLGLPADFLEDLNTDINAYEAALTRQTQGTEEHVAATAAIEDLIEDGIRIMRELDVLMRNLLADDPATLAQWLSASRVERAPKRAKKDKP
ncbi:MAG: hypothetical protein QOF02_3819 [Blastocatellia bacterium]|jgi:hypothetical protein|nr:hypothetical protein [Blastocatellia bacterium]